MVVRFKKPYNVIYINCLEATRHLDFKIISEDIKSGVIEFKTSVSIWSFGEKFRIAIRQIEINLIEVEVTSDAALKLQVIDWGKNDDNVKAFFSTIKSLLA